MTTAFQQIAFIFANVDDSKLGEEIERLRSKGELERAKGFLSQSVLEDDMLVVTELLALYCTHLPEVKEMLISDEEYLAILQKLDERVSIYTDRTIYLSFLVDTIKTSSMSTRQHALLLATHYFENLVEGPSDSALLDLLSLNSELAYNTLMALKAFYELALLGSDDTLVQLIYQSSRTLTELLASRVYRVIGFKCASMLPLAVSLFIIFSAEETADKNHMAYNLLSWLVKLLTTAEQSVSVALLASVLKITKEEGYTCTEATTSPKRSGFTLLCHTLLGAGSSITSGVSLLCRRLGTTEYEENRVEILCLFYGVCAESDLRVAKLLGRSTALLEWMNSKIGSVEPADQAAVMELADKLLTLNAIDESHIDSFGSLAKGLHCDCKEVPVATAIL